MKLLTLLLAIFLSVSVNAKPNFCASQVKEPAAKLFAHYRGVRYRVVNANKDEPYTMGKIIELPSIAAPDKKLRYTVLETTALVGKMGEYRMRFIFAILGHTNPKQDCILMGEEILDMSSL